MKSFHALMTSLVVLPLSLTTIGCGPDIDDIKATIGDHAMEIQTFSATYTPDPGHRVVRLESSEGSSCGPRADQSMLIANIFVTGDLADVPLEEPIVLDDKDQKSQVRVGVRVLTGSCEFTEGRARSLSGTVTFTELTETSVEGSIDLQVEGVESECPALASITAIAYTWSSFTTPSYSNELCE